MTLERSLFHRMGVAVLLLAGLAAGPATAAEEPPPEACHNGAYELSDESRLVISLEDSPNLRYRRPDGASGKLFLLPDGSYSGGTGWAVPGDGVRVMFGPCGSDHLTVSFVGSPSVKGRRIALPTQSITFESDGLALYGELVLPAAEEPQAIVVLQYGSDPDSAVYHNFLQHLLPLDGIGVLVFDKRGTGRSEGSYSAHFGELSDDMAAAVQAVRQLATVGDVPIGLLGESQGGWVVPLTATKTSVDFVIVAYGLAVPITEEDRLEVIQSLELRGLDDPESLAQAEMLHRAAMRVAGSKFTDGLEDLERLRTLYQAEPWFEGVGGDITGILASTPPEGIDELAEMFSFPIDLSYQPEPVIAKVDVPMLWVLAGSDTEAPHETTLSILRGRQVEGQAIDIVIFPNAEHGIIERQDGEPSLAGRHSPGYLQLLSEWIRSRTLTGPYGVGEVYEHSIDGLR